MKNIFVNFIKVLGELVFLYGFLGWLYGVTTQITRPEWLPYPFSNLTLWLILDTFMIASFMISSVGFFVWRPPKELSRQDEG